MNKVIDNWIEHVRLYPPSEIFSGKYGKDAKPEERIKSLCEDLYFFSSENKVNFLSNLFASYRELEVLYIFGFERIKPEFLKSVIENFSIASKEAIKVLDDMFKKDQILSGYYQEWKVKFSDIKTELYNMTKGLT